MKVLKNKKIFILLTILLTIVFFFLMYKIYIPRISAFGCFDDCFNFLGGYFLLNGKTIFSDFFYNHQPGMAFISYVIQIATNPQSIPELILSHRQFMILVSFIFTICLFLRFGYFIIPAFIIYELTKFYVFGDRFLAEGVVGYLLIYMVGALYRFSNKNIKLYDIAIIPLVSYLIVFLREPFVPITLFLLAVYIFRIFRISKKLSAVSFLVFFIPSVITLLLFNFSDYYLNLITINKIVAGPEFEINKFVMNTLQTFFYPIYLIISPLGFSFFRTILVGVSIIYLVSHLVYSFLYKHFYKTFIVMSSLILINLRPIQANRSFYEAFHISPWYQLIIFISLLLISDIFKKSKKIGVILLSLTFILIIYITIHPQYFAHEKVGSHEEFFTNFSHVMDTGTTIRNLSNNEDTLFVDGFDDLIIWESKLDSPYKYTWYTSVMPQVKKYSVERDLMFKDNPPDFYYGKCLIHHSGTKDITSSYIFNNYIQINPLTDKNCILIHKNKAINISQEKKDKLNGTKYIIP